MVIEGSKHKYIKTIHFRDVIFWDYFNLTKQDEFTSEYPIVSLRKVLQSRKKFIEIADDNNYKRCRVQLYGNGVVLRDIVLGKLIKTKRQQLCKTNDFVVAEIDAKFGGYGIIPKELNGAIVSSHYFLYEIDHKQLLPEYLELVVKFDGFSKQVKATGSTNYAAIRSNDVLNYKIPLPQLEEQKRLVDRYQRESRLAERQRSEVINLERELSTHLNKSFGIKKSNLKKEKFNIVQYKNIERWGLDFTNSFSNWVLSPKYPLYRVAQLCKVSSGGTPNTSNKNYYNGTIPWVRTAEVVNDIIIDTEIKITEQGLESSSAKIYPAGSLIIAMYGQGLTRGRTAKLGIDAATNQACAVLHNINERIILTDFLWIYLINEYERLRELASGNNQPNLNAGMIQDYKVQVPPKKNQQEIIKVYNSYKKKINSLQLKSKENDYKALQELEQTLFK